MKIPKPKNFEKNIFINCPFDSDYKGLLRGLLFVVVYLGYSPRIALETNDSGKLRLNKITELIKESKLGIHDISRIKAKKKNEFFRLNMAFELGLDMGARNYGNEFLIQKKFLVLEKNKHDYQKAISDLAGCDIESHDNDVTKLIKAIRDWLVTTETLNKVPLAELIWREMTEGFMTFLHTESGFDEKQIDEMPVSEYLNYLYSWQKKHSL